MAETPLFADGSPDGEPLLFPDQPVRAGRQRDDDSAPARSNTRRVGGMADPAGPPGGPPVQGSPAVAPGASPAPPRPSNVVTSVPAAGVFVGTVNGRVSADTGYRRFRGVAVLTVSGLLAAAAVLFLNAALFAVLLVLLLVPLIAWVVLGAWIGRPTTAARGAGNAIGTVAGAAVRGTRAAVRRGMGTARTRHPVTERRFQVRLLSGEFVTCLLCGDLSGDEPRHGDIVRMRGRRTRAGHYRATRVEILSSPAGPVVRRLQARLPAGLRGVRWADIACYGLSGLILLWAALTVVGVA